jgi:hypothetical protein
MAIEILNMFSKELYMFVLFVGGLYLGYLIGRRDGE